MVACVSAIVLSQDVVEHSSNLRLRSKDCLLEVHQLVPYCSVLFNFDINATLIYITLFKEGAEKCLLHVEQKCLLALSLSSIIHNY